MTIPTRPAPAPPKLSASQSAATTANYSLQQLHLLEQEQQQTQQLQQELHQQHQQQSQFAPPTKLKIKLPPSQKNSNNRTISYNNGLNGNKYSQTDYITASNLNDSPFCELISCQTAKTNSVKTVGVKKVPPPKPPPPKLSSKKAAAPPPPIPTLTTTPATVPSFQKSSNLLSNIFQRKKSTKAPTPTAAARVYNSAIYGSNASATNLSITNSAVIKKSNRSISSGHSIQQTTNSITAETQLISFDSPPSSPTFTQKSNSDCLSVDSFSSDSNFSSPNNESISQPESGFEDDFSAVAAVRSRPATTSPLDPWETCITADTNSFNSMPARYASVGTVPVRNLNAIHMQNINDNPLCNGVPPFKVVAPAVTVTMPTIIKPKISHKPKAKAPKPPILQLQTHPNNPKEKCRDEFAIPPSPPMPRYAPPPPPPLFTHSPSPSPSPSSSISEFNRNSVTIFDVISSGKEETSQNNTVMAAATNYSNSNFLTITQPYGIALYDFDSMEDGDLCFRENEVIYLLEQINNDWYRGRTRSGCEGILPANYIDIRIPLKKQAVNSNSSTNTNLNTTTTRTTNGNSCTVKGGMQAICLYNFPKEVDGDLELKENDVVTIEYKINDDWLFGEANGRKGQFPANFLDSLPAYIPTMQ